MSVCFLDYHGHHGEEQASRAAENANVNLSSWPIYMQVICGVCVCLFFFYSSPLLSTLHLILNAC